MIRFSKLRWLVSGGSAPIRSDWGGKPRVWCGDWCIKLA